VTEGTDWEIGPLTRGSRDAVLAFAREVPEHDLLFLARDITQDRVVDAWLDGLESGAIHSLVALSGDRIAGFTALLTDPLSWSPHVGELRVLVAPEWRGKGVGRALIEGTFSEALELGLEKITARMTTDQHAAIQVFEEMGFRAEALLRDHVRSRDGAKHDLAILSHDVGAMAAQHSAYGFYDAAR
jgi:GNAT superfamily N-acetyltransferase